MKNIGQTALVACLIGLGGAQNAYAGSEVQPGLSTGLSLAAPLPVGLYNVAIGDYGSRSTNPATDVGIFLPSWLIWQTPWSLLGGHVLFDASSAGVHLSQSGGANKNWISNVLLKAQLRFDLGGGFSLGIHEGVYLPGGAPLDNAFASFVQIVSASYIANGWHATASGIFGTGKNGEQPGYYAPNWINLDLTATHSFGKWEIGPVAFGSWDLNAPNASYQKQSQFAVGGLIGYDFGPVTVQTKLTRTLSEVNYGGYETRFWTNVIFALWMPPKPAEVAAKY